MLLIAVIVLSRRHLNGGDSFRREWRIHGYLSQNGYGCDDDDDDDGDGDDDEDDSGADSWSPHVASDNPTARPTEFGRPFWFIISG